MPTYELQVEVQPHYLPEESSPAQGVYRFAYTITITNTGSMPVQLISRHWIISDARGHTEEVKGLGVVGQQPLIPPGAAYQYTSGSQLRTPNGTMHGSYFCVAEDGTQFSTAIPMFMLEATTPQGSAGVPLTRRVLH
jgi:ApaG protein